MPRIRVIHWKPSEISSKVEQLGEFGFQVECEPLTARVLKEIRKSPPDAILIDLSRLPSQGRDIAINFRINGSTRYVPILFIGGDDKKVAGIRQILPDAAYTNWDSIKNSLEQALESPIEDPVIPDSIMAGYSGTPLPKKLGIKSGTVVGLINAPEGFEDTLGDLPDRVTLVHEISQACDVTLWFNRSVVEYRKNVAQYGAIAGGGRLWILWPKKASGVESDLNQKVVREVGLESGLVDYKVAKIDQTWSGLCFTKRKKETS